MSKSNLGIVLPILFAVLLICGLVLFTCAYCSNPRWFTGLRAMRDEESYTTDDEKPPVGTTLSHETVSVSSSDDDSDISSSDGQGINIVSAGPDPDESPATVIAVEPGLPPMVEVSPH